MANILLPMDLHNVFRECDYAVQDSPRNANAKVSEFMGLLISELTRRRPQWTFVSRGSSTNTDANNNYIYSRFEVRVGDEDIGWIATDHSWRTGEKSYEFDCRALKYKRTRGNSTRTKDLKKAAKLITENFREMSYNEHIYRAEQLVRQSAYRVASSRGYEFGKLDTMAKPAVMSFISANWDAFIDSVRDPELQRNLSGFVFTYEEARDARIINEQVSSKGTVVKLTGDKYVVKHLGSDEVFTYTNQTLPDELRGPIGALKLVPKETVITGLGVRGEEDSFYLMPMEATNE